MTREEAKELLPIIQAVAEGKTIQQRVHLGYEDEWIDTNLPLVVIPYNYRIKPEVKYRPFKTQEECWNEMHKHSDFGWIIYDETYHSICDVDSGGITIIYESDHCFLGFKSCIEEVTFTDGTPFGIKEEE